MKASGTFITLRNFVPKTENTRHAFSSMFSIHLALYTGAYSKSTDL